MISATVTRTNSISGALSSLRGRLGGRVERGVMAAGRVLLAASQDLVPADTTALRNSSRVRQVGSGLDTTAVVGYGIQGDVTRQVSPKERRVVVRIPFNYAWFVHEMEGLHHDEPQQANFLSQPLQTHRTEMILALRAAL